MKDETKHITIREGDTIKDNKTAATKRRSLFQRLKTDTDKKRKVGRLGWYEGNGRTSMGCAEKERYIQTSG